MKTFVQYSELMKLIPNLVDYEDLFITEYEEKMLEMSKKRGWYSKCMMKFFSDDLIMAVIKDTSHMAEILNRSWYMTMSYTLVDFEKYGLKILYISKWHEPSRSEMRRILQVDDIDVLNFMDKCKSDKYIISYQCVFCSQYKQCSYDCECDGASKFRERLMVEGAERLKTK